MKRVMGWVACFGIAVATLGCGQASNDQTQPSVSKSGSGTESQMSAPRTANPAPVRSVGWPSVKVSTAGKMVLGLVGNTMTADSSGALYSVGGYTGVYSIFGAYRLTPQLKRLVSLPQRSHDAATGFLGDSLYVFGGGQNDSYDTIVRIRNGSATTVGHLSAPLSDAVCVPFQYRGQTGLLLVGGYDGQVFRHTVEFITLQNGSLHFMPVFDLPVGVRYPAVAVQGGNVYIAGGKTASDTLNGKVYRWSSATGSVRAVCNLPIAIEKAAAFTYGPYLVVAGGLQQNGQPTSDILAVNTETGRTKVIGHLPTPIADMGYTQVRTTGYIAGGMRSSNVADNSAAILSLRMGTAQ